MMARLLLEHGADVNATTKCEPQHLARTASCAAFYDHCRHFRWGESALHLAAAQNHTDLVPLLLLNSADANSKDNQYAHSMSAAAACLSSDARTAPHLFSRATES
jgi:ankyrin repeat protein